MCENHYLRKVRQILFLTSVITSQKIIFTKLSTNFYLSMVAQLVVNLFAVNQTMIFHNISLVFIIFKF